MVSYASGAKPITVPTPPEVYHHIDALAESLGLPMGRAALVLIERGITASAEGAADPTPIPASGRVELGGQLKLVDALILPPPASQRLHSDDVGQISTRHFADKQIEGGADAEFRMRLPEAPAPLPLDQLSTDALLAEIKRRTEQVDDPLLDEAVARAKEAESQLAAIKSLLGQAG